MKMTGRQANTIGIYLNDHRAGAAAGIALTKRCRANNHGNELAAVLDRVVVEPQEDARVLTRVAAHENVRANPLKILFGHSGERTARLKLNGRVVGYSPLSRLIELETLPAGIDARRSLWRTLDVAAREGLETFEFAALGERANDQRRRLVPYHEAAAREALSSSRPSVVDPFHSTNGEF